MLRAVLLALLVLLLPTCCAADLNRAPNFQPYAEPVAGLTLIGDVDFTPAERAWVAEAATNLEVQTRGYIHVRVVFDLDFHSAASLEHYSGNDLLVKVDKAAGPVQAFDAEHCCLLGLTRRLTSPTDELFSWTTVYLVSDRIDEYGRASTSPHRLFVSTTMHELMHALGVPHVENNALAVMTPFGLGAQTHLQPADYRALCKVWGCNVRRMTNGRVSE